MNIIINKISKCISLLLIFSLFFLSVSYSQDSIMVRSYQQVQDSLLKPLDKSRITTQCLINRSYSNVDLHSLSMIKPYTQATVLRAWGLFL